MAYTWDEIRNIVEQRRSDDDHVKSQMIEVKDRYNGDYVIPMPTVEGQPEMEPPVPRLIADGIDHIAMFASSVRPVITSPAIDPIKDRGVRSKEYASIRERAMYAGWHRYPLAGRPSHAARFRRSNSAGRARPAGPACRPAQNLRPPVGLCPCRWR